MKHLFKKLGVAAMAAMLAVGTLGAFAGCAKDDPNTFTVWIGTSVNSSFYDNYGDNPVMQYLEKKFDINLEFMSPMAGQERDDFNKLVGSGEYPDMMDLSYYTDVLSDLYDDGYGAALDLTDYIAEYMPNYSAFLEENSELTKYAKVDGMYLTLNNYNEAVPYQWGGFMYRRDWLVEYGKTQTKQSFDSEEAVEDALTGTGGFIEPIADADYTSGYAYADGIVFPDGVLDEEGYDNPLTIADWEFMFDIFMQNEDCEYAITLPNKGYHETGEIVSAFGVGGLWNLYEGDTEGVYDVAKFGAATTNFRNYVETMHEWYEKGWLSHEFTSTGSDAFYALDPSAISSGTVGMWYGTSGQLGDRLKAASSEELPALENIDVWGARHPKETADSADPTIFYQDGQETTRRWIITDAAENKNIEKLLAALDWLYSEEGSIVRTYGLSAEQWNEYDIDKSLMTEYGLEDGCYWWIDPDNPEEKVPAGTEGAIVCQNPIVLNNSGDLGVAVNGNYFFGLGYDDWSKAYSQQGLAKDRAYVQWGAYLNDGTVKNSVLGQMTSDEGSTYNTTQEKVREFIATELPKLIQNGVTDQNWASFVSGLRTRDCDGNTEILQGVIDRLA